MSLINDILRDLEARQVTTGAADGFGGLSPVRRPPKARRLWLAMPVAGLLLAGSAGAVWYNGATTEQPIAFAAPARVAAMKIQGFASQSRLLGLSNTLSRRPDRNLQSKQPANTTVAREITSTGKTQEAPPAADVVRQVLPAAVPTEPVKSIDHRAAGLFALSQGEGAAAEEHFRIMLSVDASDTDAWLNLGFALKQQGKGAEAQASLGEALALAARPALLAQSLARDLIARGADAEALKILEAYRPASPLDPIHDAYVAAVLQRVGRHGDAAEVYRSVLAVRPEAADWWVGLGISEEALGLEHEALKAYRHARNIGNLDAALARYADQRIAAIGGKQQS